MNLIEELDAAIGDGPPLPQPATRLRAGQRALRRRRAAGAAAALAVVCVLGGGAWVVADGSARASGREGQVAVDPTRTPAPDRAAAVDDWADNTPIRYVDGELEVRPGVVVHRHVENPFGYAPPRRSDAFDLTFEGYRMWVLGESGKSGFGFSSVEPGVGAATFEKWVADQTVRTPAKGWPDTLRLDDHGEVVASKGSEILQRTDDPQLGTGFAPLGTPTGAAVVRAQDGIGYFVVWRILDEQLEVITVPPGDVVGATFQELLSYARGKYASGEGVR